MKTTLLLTFAVLATPVFAGTSGKAVIPSHAPSPSPSLWSWFIGGTAGYLVDADTAMYTGHIGVDTPWNVGGWDVALYLESGYATDKNTWRSPIVGSDFGNLHSKARYVPLTFNVKLERPIVDRLNVYVGAGAGVSFNDVKLTDGIGHTWKDDYTAFTAQVFGGLLYNVSDSFELYGGARWIHNDSKKYGSFKTSFRDDCLLEGGLRVNF